MPPGITAGSDQPTGPTVTFRSQEIFPPTALYVSPNDALIFTFKTPGFTGIAHLAVRFLSPDGEIIPEFYDLQVNASNTQDSTLTLPHAEGFILSAVISAGAQSRGQAFAQLRLQVGGGTGQAVEAHILCQGYLTGYDQLAYPLSPPESSISGRGVPVIMSIPDPGVGNQLIIVVPAARRWIIRNCFTFLATIGAGADRTLQVSIDSGPATVSIPICFAPIAQPVAMLWEYCIGAGLATLSTNPLQNVSLTEDLALLAGWRFKVTAFNFLPTDSFSLSRLLVEEFIAQ